jgi:hypothetical protein
LNGKGVIGQGGGHRGGKSPKRGERARLELAVCGGAGQELQPAYRATSEKSREFRRRVRSLYLTWFRANCQEFPPDHVF